MSGDVKIHGSGPVVMVDDSESDAFLARKCYEKSGIGNELLWLASGRALVELLDEVRAGKAPLPALVLLDINMPGMNGFETLERIRSAPEFENVPVVTMLTNSNDPHDLARSKELGANGFFTKPSDISDYVAFFDSLS